MGGSSAYYLRCKVFSDWSIINMGIYLLHFLKQHLTAFFFFFFWMGAQWLSGRVLDSRPKGCGFEPHRRHCVVVLEQETFILA